MHALVIYFYYIMYVTVCIGEVFTFDGSGRDVRDGMRVWTGEGGARKSLLSRGPR